MKNKTKRVIALWATGAIAAAVFVYGNWYGGILLGLFLFLGFIMLWEELVKERVEKLWPDSLRRPGS